MADALQLLRNDHTEVKELFKQFEQAEDSSTKGRIVEKAIMELEIHSKIEEEIFYPALRKQEDTEEATLDEAVEEHHVVDLIIEELRGMRPGSGRYDAKFTVLSELVKHHIDEEETELFPRAAEEGQERLERLGSRMEQRKMQLQKGMEGGGSRSGSGSRGGSKASGGSRGRAPARPTSGTRTGPRSTSGTAGRAGTSTRGAKSGAARTSASRSTGTGGRTNGATSKGVSANGRTASGTARAGGSRATGGRTASAGSKSRSTTAKGRASSTGGSRARKTTASAGSRTR